jgi:predicted O-linked N-acetylglucosamine transferase (SPINDLY family)
LNIQDIKDQFRNGNQKAAIDYCHQLLKKSPKDIELIKLLGKMYGLIGDYKNAVQMNKKAHQLNQYDEEVIYNLAYLERQSLHYVEAKKWIELLLKLNPQSYEAWVSLVEIHMKLGNYETSLERSSAALQFAKGNPNPSIYLIRAICLKHLKRYHEAIVELEVFDLRQPNVIEVMIEFGENYLALNETDLVEKYFQAAIQIPPRELNDIFIKTKAKLYFNQLEDVLVDYDFLIQHQFKIVETLHLKARLLMNFSRYDEALINLKKAEGLGDIDVLKSFGELLYHTKNHVAAISYLNQYLNTKPKDAHALMWKASNYLELNELEEAIQCFKQVLQIDPKWPLAQGFLIHELQAFCNWNNLDQERKIIQDLLSDKVPAVSPFQALSIFEDSQILQKVAQLYIELFKEEKQYKRHQFQVQGQRKKIKIGYFSPDLGQHAVSYLAIELFELHNRDEFEIYGFSLLNRKHDNFKQRVIDGFDHFLDVSTKSNDEIVQIARDLNIDIAIDLCGFTAENRFKIFESRVAPIQVSYLGYLGSMCHLMDYIIADEVLIPEENLQYFSEKVIYLPSYQINDRKKEASKKEFSKEDLGIPKDAFVFGSFNNSYKITPEIFKVWMELLKEVPQSVLMLSAPQAQVKENLLREAQKYSIDTNRIIFSERVAREEYLTRLKLIDLFLDTPIYGAGTTASDVLWMGVPVLTILGKSFPARIASSVLTSFGMPELIVNNLNEYKLTAKRIAQNESEFLQIKNKVASLISASQLFDSETTTRNIEKAYLEIYQRYLNGQVPDHIKLLP